MINLKQILTAAFAAAVIITPVALYHPVPTVTPVVQVQVREQVKEKVKVTPAPKLQINCDKVREVARDHLEQVKQMVSAKTLAAIKKQCNIKD